MKCSVIVPSCDDSKIRAFANSLAKHEPDMDPSQLVVVSDGLSDQTRKILDGVKWVEGRKPFVFAKAINDGARAASGDDLLIVGDDVRFQTVEMIRRLQSLSGGCAAIVPQVSGSGAPSSVCGQPAQLLGSQERTAQWIAFICVYIPRAAWNQVGELDEQFVGYGYDDVDWCLRAREYGPLRIDRGSWVLHAHQSSYRSQPDWIARYDQNRQLFERKWKGEAA
jgi:GT2 family glycosyltransferase